MEHDPDSLLFVETELEEMVARPEGPELVEDLGPLLGPISLAGTPTEPTASCCASL